MKIEYDGEWTKYTDDEGCCIDLGLYFEKIGGKYYVGLDDFYNTSMSIEKLKLLSEFLVEYIKKEESL